MHIHVGGRTMASCRTKSVVQRRVQGNNNPTMHEMVLDAIGRCKDPTGISLQGIKTSILCEYPEVDPNTLKVRAAKALDDCLANGLIRKPENFSEKPEVLGKEASARRGAKTSSARAVAPRNSAKSSRAAKPRTVTPRRPALSCSSTGTCSTGACLRKPAKTTTTSCSSGRCPSTSTAACRRPSATTSTCRRTASTSAAGTGVRIPKTSAAASTAKKTAASTKKTAASTKKTAASTTKTAASTKKKPAKKVLVYSSRTTASQKKDGPKQKAATAKKSTTVKKTACKATTKPKTAPRPSCRSCCV